MTKCEKQMVKVYVKTDKHSSLLNKSATTAGANDV